MQRLRTHAELRTWREALPPNATVGCVPTMGALHRGHASLLEAAREQCAVNVATIFVNPLQFNEGADFKRYPRTEDEDCALLAEYGMAAVYLPGRDDIYPEGYETRVRPGPGGELYEGYHRPGHFEGMLTVVLKLLQRTRPQRAFFGEKDAQQLWLVRRMARDLDLPVEIVGCPTVREDDGLAASSRNAFLTPEQREAAVVVHEALSAARRVFADGGSHAAVERALLDALRSEPIASIEYAELVDDRSFRPADPSRSAPWRAVVGVRIGGTRLIDNLLLGDFAGAQD